MKRLDSCQTSDGPDVLKLLQTETQNLCGLWSFMLLA